MKMAQIREVGIFSRHIRSFPRRGEAPPGQRASSRLALADRGHGTPSADAPVLQKALYCEIRLGTAGAS